MELIAMSKRRIVAVVATILSLSLGGRYASAQSEDLKFEVGAQALLVKINNEPFCFACPGKRTELGFGGRFAYNINNYVALEGEVDFFPRSYEAVITPVNGGRIIEGLFGVKSGKRLHKIGMFGKARPGFLRYTQAETKIEFPNGNGPLPGNRFGIEFGGVSHFAMDFGGIVELYPSRRTIVRFDAGDTIVRYANIPVFLQNGQLVAESRNLHNLQVSVGFGLRF
jgi:hypothetical protein